MNKSKSKNRKRFVFIVDKTTATALVRLSKERDQSMAGVLRSLIRQEIARKKEL